MRETQSWYNRKWGLIAHCSKANKEVRLVERKVYFISDAHNGGRGRADTSPKAESTPLTISEQKLL